MKKRERINKGESEALSVKPYPDQRRTKIKIIYYIYIYFLEMKERSSK